jgi:hypothetical protein
MSMTVLLKMGEKVLPDATSGAAEAIPKKRARVMATMENFILSGG